MIKQIAPFLLSIFLFANICAQDALIRGVFVDGREQDLTDSIFTFKTSQQLAILFFDLIREGGNHYRLIQNDTVITIAETFFEACDLPLVFFPTLEQGRYIFEAYNSSDKDKRAISALTFEVKSAFIDNWAFFILLILYLILLFGGAIYIIILTNNRNKEKLTDLRSDWTNKLHNDIGGDLSSVSIRLDTLKRRLEPLDPQIKEGVIKTYDILKDIQKKLRFVFNLVDPKRNSLHVMLTDVIDFAHENMTMKNMALLVQNTLPEKMEDKIDIGRINKLYLAMKEVINNCLKYSDAQNVYLDISKNKFGLAIEINDDGKGFDLAKSYEGNGLKSLQQYSQEGLIDIKIDTALGRGTKVTILTPFL